MTLLTTIPIVATVYTVVIVGVAMAVRGEDEAQ